MLYASRLRPLPPRVLVRLLPLLSLPRRRVLELGQAEGVARPQKSLKRTVRVLKPLRLRLRLRSPPHQQKTSTAQMRG